MCKTHHHLENYKPYNWDGDRIIHDSTVSKTRSIPHTDVKYKLDIRELLLSEHNTVIKSALENIKKKIPKKQQRKFIDREEGCFDFRARAIKEYVEHKIAYCQNTNKKFDDWLFPDETLTLKQGDCEDRAILMAALMMASGISSYNIRVALGYVMIPDDSVPKAHAWLMYKDECGNWQVVEPDDYTTQEEGKLATNDAVYRPYFVFNNDHLWGIEQAEDTEHDIDNDNCFSNYKKRTFFDGFNPTFGFAVHEAIVKASFEGIKQEFYDCLTSEMRSELALFGPVERYVSKLAKKINWVDITLNYDALNHFDNAQIDNGVKQLVENLRADTIDGLAKALHALHDFYAHTSYAHFAQLETPNSIKLANISIRNLTIVNNNYHTIPQYDQTGTFNLNNVTVFTVNKELFKDDAGNPLSVTEAIRFWDGQIVSGRYGQPDDSKTLFEPTQFVDESLPHLNMAAGLPHHEEIAVDKESGNNQLYSDPVAYQRQFGLRKDAAIRHTKKLVLEWIEQRKRNNSQ